MGVPLSKVRWGRVLLAGAATHLINVVLIAVAAFVYTLLAIGAQGVPEGTLIDRFAGQVGTWSVPVLTIFAAVWVVRKVRPETAALHGLLVGLLVAVIFGLAFFWPFDLATLLLFASMVAAGLLGSLIGRTGWELLVKRENEEAGRDLLQDSQRGVLEQENRDPPRRQRAGSWWR